MNAYQLSNELFCRGGSKCRFSPEIWSQTDFRKMAAFCTPNLFSADSAIFPVMFVILIRFYKIVDSKSRNHILVVITIC